MHPYRVYYRLLDDDSDAGSQVIWAENAFDAMDKSPGYHDEYISNVVMEPYDV
jgi:hypothetical protein